MPPEKKYRLAYGGQTLEAPNYDTAALRDLLAANYRPIDAKAGAQMALADAALEPETSLAARVLSSPRFLMVVVSFFVALLALGIYRATKRLEEISK